MNEPKSTLDRDRRKQPRVVVSIAVDIETEHNFYASKTRDISTGGLFVETDAPLAIGAQLVLRMRLRQKHFLTLAEVMWQLVDESERPVGVGVRFVDAPRSMRSAIDEFVRLRRPIEFEQPALDDSV